MNPGELYTRLGLQPDATPVQIRRAYRRAAKTAHPDTGGSAEQWAAILEAYETLIEPRRRRIYDDTGSVEPGAADNHYAALLMRLAAAMDEIAADNPQLAWVDWPRMLRIHLNAKIQQDRQGILDLASRAREWDAVAQRCIVPPGAVNVLRGLAEGKAAECRRRCDEAQATIREHEEALQLIENARSAPAPQLTIPQQMAQGGQIGPMYIGRMW
jgi:hypothetical protein